MGTRRFVVLRHEPGVAGPSQLHWDLMLEFGDCLRTWSLQSEPRAGTEVPADELPRHRLDYLDYEGPISQGRGIVSRFDQGTFELLRDSPEQVTVDLHGERLEGRLQLTQDATNQRWTACFASN